MGERAAVNQRRVVFQRLHQVSLYGVLQKCSHRPMGPQLRREYRFLGPHIAYDDAAEALAQIGEALSEAEDRHHLRGDHNVKAILPRKAIAGPTQCDDEVAQRSVIHVDHTLPSYTTRVDFQFVAVMDVIVDERSQQVIGQRDGGEVAGEMKVTVLHRNHLGVATTGGTAFHAKDRTERRFAQTDHRFLAAVIQCVAQTDSGGSLALPGRPRANRADEDQFPIWAISMSDIIDLGLY